MSDERQMGRMEAGIETLISTQNTMAADLKDHRQEVAEMHLLSMTRITEVEGDVERVEAKIDGHADEDNKRFSTMRWTVGIVVTISLALAGAFQALAQ